MDENLCKVNIFNKSTSKINNGIDTTCYRHAFNREHIDDVLSDEKLIDIINIFLQKLINHEFNITELNYINKQVNNNGSYNYYIIFQISYVNHNNYPLFATKKLFINFEINQKNIKLLSLKNAHNSYESILDRPKKNTKSCCKDDKNIDTLSLLYDNENYNDELFMEKPSLCYNMDTTNYQNNHILSNYPILFESNNYII